MKTLLLTFAIFFTLCVCAQTPTPQGTVIFKEFDNSNASFTVPEGKSWYIYNIYSDYVVGGTVKYDEYSKQDYLNSPDDVRIFIKDFNGTMKTDYLNNIYGPQVYRSTNASTVIPFPLIYSEKTSFTLISLRGDLGHLKPYAGTCYISIVEVTN